VEFEKIRRGVHRYVTDKDLVEIVRKLARIEPDARIASILNRNQRLTAQWGNMDGECVSAPCAAAMRFGLR